jgi:PilZ domain
VDRRSTRRYDVTLPITVDRYSPQTVESLVGKTRDLSIGGIYFTTGQELLPGREFDFTARFPATLTQGREVLIRARGKVVRTEKEKADDNERVGIAAVIEKYEFVLAEPS